MGYPIIVTPVSQLVATQAVRNVIDDERWANVSDETVRYFLGHYGEPAAPVAADVAERVLCGLVRKVRCSSRCISRRGRSIPISDGEEALLLTMPEGRWTRCSPRPRAPGRAWLACRGATSRRCSEVPNAGRSRTSACNGRRAGGWRRGYDDVRLCRSTERSPSRRRGATCSPELAKCWRRTAPGRPVLSQRQPRAAETFAADLRAAGLALPTPAADASVQCQTICAGTGTARCCCWHRKPVVPGAGRRANRDGRTLDAVAVFVAHPPSST
jgi:hypothetical protein